MPEYVGQRLAGRRLVIAPLSREAIVNNPNDVLKDFRYGAVEPTITEFLMETLPDTLRRHSLFGSIVADSFATPPVLSARSFPGTKPGEALAFKIPADGTVLTFARAPVVDVVLFIETFEVGRGSSEGVWNPMNPANAPNPMNPMPVMSTGGYENKLTYTGRYLFWDNEVGRVISYGKYTGSANLVLRDVMQTKASTWREALVSMSKSLVKDGPFER